MTEMLLNTARAAEVLGISVSTVRQACAKYWAIADAEGEDAARLRISNGRILACRRAGYGQRATYYVDPADLAAYRSNRALGHRGWSSGKPRGPRPPEKRKPRKEHADATES